MKTYELHQSGKVIAATDADNIDHALDYFFPHIRVDVDLDTASDTRLDVHPLHARRSIDAYIIQERVP